MIFGPSAGSTAPIGRKKGKDTPALLSLKGKVPEQCEGERVFGEPLRLG